MTTKDLTNKVNYASLTNEQECVLKMLTRALALRYADLEFKVQDGKLVSASLKEKIQF